MNDTCKFAVTYDRTHTISEGTIEMFFVRYAKKLPIKLLANVEKYGSWTI